MSTRATSSACIGLVLLGLSASLCLGLYDLDFLPQLSDNSDVTDNKENFRIVQVTEQYGEEDGGRRKQSASPALLAEHAVGKRATQERTPEEMSFKSRPGFRSWGGKRARFANWGGKRGRFTTWGGKRSKFNNWGGKRSDRGYGEGPERIEEFLRVLRAEQGYERQEGKRDKFQNWGGKRGSDDARRWSDGERLGKRDFEYSVPYEQDNRRREEEETEEYGPEEEDEERGKGGRTRSIAGWSGKRTMDRGGEDLAWMNWILRSYFDSVLSMLENDRRVGKKSVFQDESDSTKQGFSAWKGRR